MYAIHHLFLVATAQIGETLTFTAKNEYGTLNVPNAFSKMFPYSKMIEPYKDTVLSITGYYTSMSTMPELKWRIEGYDELFNGSSITIFVKNTGIFNLNIKSFDKNGKEIASMDATLISK